jgi:hypothetical protein
LGGSTTAPTAGEESPFLLPDEANCIGCAPGTLENNHHKPAVLPFVNSAKTYGKAADKRR